MCSRAFEGESVDNEVAEIIEASEGAIVVELVGTSRGRASGEETELRSWQLLRFADGKIARRQIYWTREEAGGVGSKRER
jgi:ketosteroid isomerase-like protein